MKILLKTVDQTIKAVQNLIIEDCRIAIRQIAYALGISVSTAHRIIHGELHMNKVCSRWVPHLLTPDQRYERVQSCQELLACYAAEGDNFFRIINSDESFMHYYQTEAKQSSEE